MANTNQARISITSSIFPVAGARPDTRGSPGQNPFCRRVNLGKSCPLRGERLRPRRMSSDYLINMTVENGVTTGSGRKWRLSSRDRHKSYARLPSALDIRHLRQDLSLGNIVGPPPRGRSDEAPRGAGLAEDAMRILLLPLTARFIAYTSVLLLTAILLIVFFAVYPSIFVAIPLALFAALSALGTMDLVQSRHAVLRNYPLTAHIRFILEEIRPEIRQYFLESEKDGTPFSRDKRAIVYQRAKHALDKRPFGTQNDVYASGYEWLHHSMAPKPPVKEPFRIVVGGPDCGKPYSASIFNISAMSFGALSPNAIRALNIGAKKGNFAHDTGEGGYSRYHRENGGDLIWEIGSGYFGCRNADGSSAPRNSREGAQSDQVKMVELKLSQGAKPGHGGVLPGRQGHAEIAATRGVPIGVDCISPSRHSAFSTPIEMLEFIATMRRYRAASRSASSCASAIRGNSSRSARRCWRRNLSRLHRRRRQGRRHRRGAARIHRSSRHAAARGAQFRAQRADRHQGPRPHQAGAAGKIISAFDIARVMALGADWCNAARGFMFALGCIQSQSCHTDRCPTGVATQDRVRQRALVVPDKAERVYNFHHATLEALADLWRGGARSSEGIRAGAFFAPRFAARGQTFAELYPALSPANCSPAPSTGAMQMPGRWRAPRHSAPPRNRVRSRGGIKWAAVGLLRGLPCFEEPVRRPRQAEILAQRLAFVLAPEQAAPLQLRHDRSTKSSSPPGRYGNITVKPSVPSVASHSSISSAMVLGVPTIASPE